MPDLHWKAAEPNVFYDCFGNENNHFSYWFVKTNHYDEDDIMVQIHENSRHDISDGFTLILLDKTKVVGFVKKTSKFIIYGFIPKYNNSFLSKERKEFYESKDKRSVLYNCYINKRYGEENLSQEEKEEHNNDFVRFKRFVEKGYLEKNFVKAVKSFDDVTVTNRTIGTNIICYADKDSFLNNFLFGNKYSYDLFLREGSIKLKMNQMGYLYFKLFFSFSLFKVFGISPLTTLKLLL